MNLGLQTMIMVRDKTGVILTLLVVGGLMIRRVHCDCASQFIRAVGVIAGPCQQESCFWDVTVKLSESSDALRKLVLYSLGNSSSSVTLTRPASDSTNASATFRVPRVLPETLLIAGVAIKNVEDSSATTPTVELSALRNSTHQAVTFVFAPDGGPSGSDLDASSVAQAESLLAAFGYSSCTSQLLRLTRGPLTSLTLSAVRLCPLGGRLQYAAVSNIESGQCPEVVISEFGSFGTAGSFVELHCHGCPGADLSGYAVAFFNISTNTSYRVMQLTELTTNALGYAVVGSYMSNGETALKNSFKMDAINADQGLFALYLGDARANGSSGQFRQLVMAADRGSVVAAVAYGVDASALVQPRALLNTLTGSAKQAVWVVTTNRSRSVNVSLSFCYPPRLRVLLPAPQPQLILSSATPWAPNECDGLPATADRRILTINEFNADIPRVSGGRLLEFIELAVNTELAALHPNLMLANYYVVLYSGTNSRVSKVFDLKDVTITPGKLYVLVGTRDVCGDSCDMYMLGGVLPNSLSAIAVYYREQGSLTVGMVATLDGLIDAVVYTADTTTFELELARLLRVDSSHIVYEDENAFLGDESVGVCEKQTMMSLMLLTPGRANNCTVNPAAALPRTSLTPAVYINEWHLASPLSTGNRLSRVELVGRPGLGLHHLALTVARLDTGTGAVLALSPIAKLPMEAVLSAEGFYVFDDSTGALAINATTSNGVAYRLMLASRQSAPSWVTVADAEMLVPQDAVAIASSAASDRSGAFVLLDFVLSNDSVSVSRCRLNASAPASSAANSAAFDVLPVTLSTTNRCVPRRGVLINELGLGGPSNLFVELLIQDASAITSRTGGGGPLDGFVLVYWNGTDGTVVSSASLTGAPQPRDPGRQLVVLGPDFAAGAAMPPVGRHVAALYYDYDFLYPVGKRQATAVRLNDAAAYSNDIGQTWLPTTLLDVLHRLYPDDADFYRQGVVAIGDTTKDSLSRCQNGTGLELFEPLTATKGTPNLPCPSARGTRAVSVLHCVQQQTRLTEIFVNSSDTLIVELAGIPGLPLSNLALVLTWSTRSSNWTEVRFGAAQAISDGATVPSAGYYLNQLPISNDTWQAAVVCVLLVFKSAYQVPLGPAAPEAVSAKATIDAIAIRIGPQAGSDAFLDTWPMTPSYPPLGSAGGLSATRSVSRCYSDRDRASAAFSTASERTPGQRNDCPPPPLQLQYACTTAIANSTSLRALTVELEGKVPMLPLERIRLVAYDGGTTLLPFINAQLAASNLGLSDKTLIFSANYNTSMGSNTALAVALYFSSDGWGDNGLSLENRDQPLSGLTDAMVLNFKPGEGMWQRLSAPLNVSYDDVPLVSISAAGNTPACAARCQTASGWSVRSTNNPTLTTCPPLTSGPVVINEVDIDQPGLDSRQFIELKGPAGLDASDYQITVFHSSQKRTDIDLRGTFNPKGYFVIGTKALESIRNMPFPDDVAGLLSSIGGGIALYKKLNIQGAGLVDAIVYASSQAGVRKVETDIPLLMDSKLDVLVEDTGKYGGNETLSRCFCNAPRNSACFGLSWLPTPGAENHCVDGSNPEYLKFCVNHTAVELGTVKQALASAISEMCACAFSIYNLAEIQVCESGVQVAAFSTSKEHMAVIRRSFQAVLDKGQLPVPGGGTTLSIHSNCSLSCTATVTLPPATGPSGGVVAAIVVTVILLIAIGTVSVYIIRKKRADRGFQMARFDGTFDDDDGLVSDNAAGRVTFTNPFRSGSGATERRRYEKL